jgi:phage protein D
MPDQALVTARPVLRRKGQEEQRLAQALQALTLHMPPDGLDHAEVELVNWGSGEDGGDSGYALQDIALGDTLAVAFGAEPAVVFDGEITGVEERYGEGAPKLVLLAEDRLHRLARKRRSRVFEEQSVDDIVSSIASEAQLTPDVQVSTAAITVHQLDESDLALLRRLLRPFGVMLRLDAGSTLRARAPEPSGEALKLDAADNALRVRVTADLARQISTAKVGGYNVPAGELVDASQDALEPAPSGRAAADHLGELGWDAEARAPWPVGLSSGHGSDLAKGVLARHAGSFLRGDLVCEGDPRLKPGVEIELAGVSPRLAGKYGVVSCVHRFDTTRGYECYATIARPDWNP